MKRKKQGTTLIVGIIIFAFVITVMTAMLSMVAGGYNARVVDSKRVENLYSSESGLDVAYNIIGRTFNVAVSYGNIQVDNLTTGKADSNNSNREKYEEVQSDIDYWKNRKIQITNPTTDDIKAFEKENRSHIAEDDENIELLKNEEFKRAFNEFLYRSGNDLDETKDAKNVDELAKSIVGKKYVENIAKDQDSEIYKSVKFNNNVGQEEPELFVYDDKNPTASIATNKDKSGISYRTGDKNQEKSISRSLQGGYNLNIDVYDNQEYIVKVTSNFETTNSRQVQATYAIKVPEYGQSLKEYPILENKSLVVGKNMNLSNANSLTVDGDVFVQGEMTEETGDIAYDKYLGGIKIDKSKNVNFTKDVITRSTFNIIDEVGVNIQQNLYARNVYVGNGNDFASGLAADKSKLNILNDLIVDNDLALKAHNTDVTIKNFYGINDHTNNDTNDMKKRNSSSIIVNKDKNEEENPFTSSIDITNEAWIMGAAYINTDGKYETGESIGVKGNYEAYTASVDSDKDKNLSFEYDNPLYVINGTVFEKGDHFVDYWSKSNNQSNIDTGGIKLSTDNLNNIHSIGAIVFENKDGVQLQRPNYHMDDKTTISEKQKDYASKVYKFGKESDDDYNVGENGATNVSELIDLSNINDLNYNLKDQEKKSEKAIFNNDESRKIIIRKSSGEGSIDDSDSDIVIEAKDGILDAVIVTNGDVSIEGNVTFKGSIITNGILEIGGDNITISQDNDVVKNIQAQNLDLFESVFKDGQYYNETTDYDLSNYLENKLWKLIK